ncbi:hypothetical protein M0R45_002019 [Rubus argutus]|uniref:Uncharacterized protein n=1 Tax=Rubus argutus TaxID=59490 RepID=A0AAW1VIC0_RUBAR
MASRGSLRRRAGRRRRRLCDLRSGLRSPIWVEHGAGSTARGRAGSTAELLAGSVMGSDDGFVRLGYPAGHGLVRRLRQRRHGGWLGTTVLKWYCGDEIGRVVMVRRWKRAVKAR